MTGAACTVVARRDLPGARVLAASYAGHHPSRRLAVLVVDEPAPPSGDEPFDVIRPGELSLAPDEFRRMAAVYDEFELTRALKPWVLELLLARGASSVGYLAADSVVYAPLDDLFALAERESLVLTPQVTTPVPRDDRTIEEGPLMGTGVYNTGFLVMSAAARHFLGFWKERLRNDGLVDQAAMRFADQRWVDFAPGIFECHVLEDRGVNVGYWNLHDRPVEVSADGWVAGKWPLRVFRFSGYSPAHPHRLSGDQGRQPRILLSEHPALAELCHRYGDALVAAGWGSVPVGYGWAAAHDGLVLDRTTRGLLRLAVIDAEEKGAPPPPDPFTAAGARQLLAMLNEPPGRGDDPGRLSIYLATRYGHTPGIHRQFPDPQAADRDRYLAWARDEVSAGRIDHRLVPGRQGVAAPGAARPLTGEQWAPAGALAPGVLVAGHLAADHPVGEASRRLLGTLEQAGVTCSRWTWTSPVRFPQQLADDVAPDEVTRRDCRINLVAVEPDRVDAFVNRVGPGFFAGRYSIAQWMWPLEHLPADLTGSFAPFWEIWAPSEFSRAAIAARTDKPVWCVPPPVTAPAENGAGIDRTALGLAGDRTIVVAGVDLLAPFERTNPDGAVRAFCRAFSPGEGPVLVLLVARARTFPVAAERLRHAVGDRPDVVIIERDLDAAGRAAVTRLADGYLSLHRSTAFGLAMADAMAAGVPVVATGYSGNLQYMTGETALLVPCGRRPVPAGVVGLPTGGEWAEPDLDVAASLLRQVAGDPEGARARGAAGRHHVETHHGPGSVVPVLRGRIDAVQRIWSSTLGTTARGGPDARGVRRRVERAVRVLVRGHPGD